MSYGVKSGSGGFNDQRFWLSVGLGLGAGAVIAYLGLPSYFSDGGTGMMSLGYAIFMIGGAVLGSIVGSLLLRPDAGH
jgi:hypothetical protein